MFAISLRTKFLSMVIAMIVLMGLIMITFIQTFLTKRLTSELQKTGIFIAQDIAEESINSIMTESIFPLQLLVIQHKLDHESIEYIFIVNRKNHVVAHTFGEAFPVNLKDANILSSHSSHQIKPIIVEKGKLFDIAVPILQGEIGVVHVGLLEKQFIEAIGDITEKIIWIIVILSILGSVIAIVFATTVTKPILELIKGTKIIGDGDLGHKISIKTNDEIGQLATAYAMMTKKLQVLQSRERLVRIGAISAGVAHTIRNPLHGAINCTEILQKRIPPDDSVAHEMFDLMMEGLNRIEIITRRLLVLTRDSPLQKGKIDINVLISNALSFIEARAEKKKIRLVKELTDFSELSVDSDRFSEALINLFENALDACQEGDRVTIKTNIEAGNRSCIWVEDSGQGISEENLAKVFDPFFTTKLIGQGSGLGLAITRRIIEEHEGEITLESTVGKGTRFRILFPSESDS